MMGFDPRKWLSGLGPQTEPTVEQFRNYHVTPSTATGKYAAAGNLRSTTEKRYSIRERTKLHRKTGLLMKTSDRGRWLSLQS